MKEKLSVPDSLRDTANNDTKERFHKNFCYLCIANYPEISDFQLGEISHTFTIFALVTKIQLWSHFHHTFVFTCHSLLAGGGGVEISFWIDTHHACTGVEEEGFVESL